MTSLSLITAVAASIFEAKAVPTIDHKPVACVIAGKFPRLEARIDGADSNTTARVYFQGATKDWYSVAMKAEGGALIAVLPSPKKDLKEFHYYIEAVNRAVETARTPDYAATVVSGATSCGGKTVAAVGAGASILVQAPAGVASVPSGFASTGLIAAGGGISGTTVAAVGVAVGGGALAVAKVTGGGDNPEYAGPFSSSLSLTFGGACTRVERYSGTLWIELSDSGGTAGLENGRVDIVSTTPGCTTGPQPGSSSTFGMQNTAVNRGGGALSFTQVETGTTVDGSGTRFTDTYTFNGSLSGETIGGTFAISIQLDGTNGRVTGATPASPVTLTRR